eukprot:scaffold104723_cov33-Tisochrysis_lutea.AAC.2
MSREASTRALSSPPSRTRGPSSLQNNTAIASPSATPREARSFSPDTSYIRPDLKKYAIATLFSSAAPCCRKSELSWRGS